MKPIDKSRLSPRARAALRCAIGVILFCTAIYYAALRLFFDLHEISNGGPIGKPGIYAVGLLFFPFAVLWAIGAFLFTLTVFSRRCPEGGHCFVAAIAALAFMAALFFRPGLGFLLPALLFGKATGSSLIGYFGAVIQIALGGWLLGWFDRWLRRNEANAV